MTSPPTTVRSASEFTSVASTAMADEASGDDAVTDKAAATRAERAAAAKVAEKRFRQLRESGDRQLRNELIEEHRWVAIHCARRFDRRGEPLDDLIQVGQ